MEAREQTVADRKRDDARVNFNIVVNAMKSGNLSYESLSATNKTQLQRLSLEAGFPADLLSTIIPKVKADILWLGINEAGDLKIVDKNYDVTTIPGIGKVGVPKAPTIKNFGTERKPDWRQWDSTTQSWIPTKVSPIEPIAPTISTEEEGMSDEDILKREIIPAYDEGKKYGAILKEIQKKIKNKTEQKRWIKILREEERKRAAEGKRTTGWSERFFQPGI